MSKLKYFDGTNWNEVGGKIAGDTLPIGAIVPFGGWDAPTGWLICDGTLLNKTAYPELFNAIGYSFGGEEGGSTFGLPDLRGRVPVGLKETDTDFDGMGVIGGSKYLQEHNHMGRTYSKNYNAGQTIPGGRAYARSYVPSDDTPGVWKYSGSGAVSGAEITSMIETGNSGTGNSGNLQPYQTVNYIIKAKQSAGLVANVSNTQSDSTTDTYSCNYVNGIIASGANANGYYTKYTDGTLICRYYVGPLTINSNSGATQAVTFPISFIDTNWQCMIQLTNGQNYWSWIATAVKSKTASGFTLDIWNNSEGQCPGQYFDYIAIGRWK